MTRRPRWAGGTRNGRTSATTPVDWSTYPTTGCCGWRRRDGRSLSCSANGSTCRLRRPRRGGPGAAAGGENRRLTAELRASLEQVRDSRARIVAAGDDTRRRIERDLHDGAQQLLISTGIKLNLAAAEQVDGDPALAGALDEASAELSRALVELRNLASGIAPASLVHGTSTSRYAELALHSVRGPDDRFGERKARPDEGVAATVYFVVAECLTNIAKHAGAPKSRSRSELGDPLRVTIADDGAAEPRWTAPAPGCVGSSTGSRPAAAGSGSSRAGRDDRHRDGAREAPEWDPDVATSDRRPAASDRRRRCRSRPRRSPAAARGRWM